MLGVCYGVSRRSTVTNVEGETYSEGGCFATNGITNYDLGIVVLVDAQEPGQSLVVACLSCERESGVPSQLL